MTFYFVHFFRAAWEIVHYMWRITWRPVSYPGDAIKKPLTRLAKWPKRSMKLTAGWTFASDEESHEISNTEYPATKLLGPSAGRQIWYKKKGSKSEGPSFSVGSNPNSADILLREQLKAKWEGPIPNEKSKPESAREACVKALSYYQMLQCGDGHWAGDYGGPMFLMPGLITALYITKAPFSSDKKEAMKTYLQNHQQEDGGWGTHIECASTMFGTVLSYVSLRLLGEEPDRPYMLLAREFIISHGGALYSPSWCKFWLAVLGVYEWEGINSIPAEMWYLPRSFPFHPGKLWCHCRMVYLPMCYVYCKRFAPDVSKDPVLQSLRKELFIEEYSTIKWDAYRQVCAEIDDYSPLNPIMKIAQDFLALYEKVLPYVPPLVWLRRVSLDFVISYIHEEDIQTNYIDIGPVNKALNLLAVWVASGGDNDNEQFQRHLPRVDDYLWVAEDGMKMQGYNGSQCWDTSFAVQAIVEGDLVTSFPECSRKVYAYLNDTQIKENEEKKVEYYRHESKGGWPFSTAAHGWPISDCTAEGLKGVLALHKKWKVMGMPDDQMISDERLYDAVNVILTYHNEDGGWATYENNRGYGWYEMLNPSEVFGDIMIDYSYVECTSACMTALRAFYEVYPTHRPAEILNAIQAGKRFIKSIQRPDGSWYGSWGISFTYGTWFGIEALLATGEPLSSPSLLAAETFLLSTQKPNGGWGESYLSSVNKAYPPEGTGEVCGDSGSGIVQTAWALLGLLALDSRHEEEIHRGVRYLMAKQLPDGDFPQEGITGVFNRSCGITYSQYRNIFTMWALARYANKYGDAGESKKTV